MFLSHRENVKWSEALSSKKHPQFLTEDFKPKMTHFVIDKIFLNGMRDQNGDTAGGMAVIMKHTTTINRMMHGKYGNGPHQF
jgi:hypothetical protein